ncbi:hypothetical protein NOCARDAX2BIS_60008 [Nocardioides sp. AX2bis]|nr:hypothetical protein NOCARDAX2BIS_60008 [Nocardioides sp. AX2bis]
MHLLAGARRLGDHRRGQHLQRHPCLVLQLRLLRRPLRSRPEHHLGLDRQHHGHEHHLGHLDGLPARRRRRRPLPPGQPLGHAVDGDERAARQRHEQRGQRYERLAEPAALLVLLSRTTSRTGSTHDALAGHRRGRRAVRPGVGGAGTVISRRRERHLG